MAITKKPPGSVSTERLIWVSLPYACFGLIVRGGQVVEAAPIARWAIGKPEREVAAFYRRKGAEFRGCEVRCQSG